jgi:hypothetical protein
MFHLISCLKNKISKLKLSLHLKASRFKEDEW